MTVFNLLALPKEDSEHEGIFLSDCSSLEDAKEVQRKSNLTEHHFWIEENVEDAKGDEFELRRFVLLYGQTEWEEISLRDWLGYEFPEVH